MRNLIFVIFTFMLLVSCTAQKQIIEIPVETVKTEYIHNIKTDSVFVKDSVDRWIKGDTVFIYKEHTTYKYKDRTDTVFKTDTIPNIINIETIKEVEVNHIRWYQKILMWLGGIMGVLLITYITYKIRK